MKDIYGYLSLVEDFRMEKKCLHKLSDILFTGLLTYLSNGEGYEDIFFVWAQPRIISSGVYGAAKF